MWSTGRADYFGNLPNSAARVMALALPGQVLLEGFHGFGPELVHRDDHSALLPHQPSRIAGHPDYEAVEVLQLGKFPIKQRQICQSARVACMQLSAFVAAMLLGINSTDVTRLALTKISLPGPNPKTV